MFKFCVSAPNEESVYNLVRKEDHSRRKENESNPIYRSIYSAKVRKEVSDNKLGPSKTLGVPRKDVGNPSLFLRKHSKRPFATRPKSVPGTLAVEKGSQAGAGEVEVGEAKVEETQKPTGIRPKTCTRICNDNNRKPPIQPAHFPLQILLQDNKDFVNMNAVNVLDNSKLTTKPKALRYVDMSTGNTELWYNSGLAPQYIHRKNFGKVPNYITKRKKELIEAEEAQRRDASRDDSGVQKLSKEDISKMAAALKENWHQVFNLYQSLPLQIDTPGKIKTKARLEAELKRLENDIQTLQRHDLIFVADVPRSYYVPTIAKRG